MKTLVLMRHAEANWSGRSSDFDRPLNERQYVLTRPAKMAQYFLLQK